MAAASVAQGQGQAPPRRPAYDLLRFNEDWSVLRDAPAGAPEDFFDPVKYVPFDEEGTIWASFGGSTRLRVENWHNFAFGGPGTDDTFLLWRMLLHGDFHLGQNLRAFVQGKSAQSTERDLPGGTRTLDVDSLDLEEAFADLRLELAGDASLVLRAGRQWLLLGKQRLVSPLEWSNTFRRWDGFSAIASWKRWTAQAFWAEFVPVEKYEFNEPDAGTILWGAYATGPILGDTLGLDLYLLGLQRDGPIAFNGTAGSERRYTVGGRLGGRVARTGFDYDLEGAWQGGRVGEFDADAFMLGGEAGWTAEGAWSTPRFFAGVDLGSGDDQPGGDVETFDQLFPLGHAYLGYVDVIGRQNVVSVSAGVSLKPLERMTVRLAGYSFWRDSARDAVYDAGGAVVRAGGLGASSEVGQEVDLTVLWRFDRHLTGLLGYSHFFPGDFIRESGTAEAIDFVYAQLEYTF